MSCGLDMQSPLIFKPFSSRSEPSEFMFATSFGSLMCETQLWCPRWMDYYHWQTPQIKFLCVCTITLEIIKPKRTLPRFTFVLYYSWRNSKDTKVMQQRPKYSDPGSSKAPKTPNLTNPIMLVLTVLSLLHAWHPFSFHTQVRWKTEALQSHRKHF